MHDGVIVPVQEESVDLIGSRFGNVDVMIPDLDIISNLPTII